MNGYVLVAGIHSVALEVVHLPAGGANQLAELVGGQHHGIGNIDAVARMTAHQLHGSILSRTEHHVAAAGFKAHARYADAVDGFCSGQANHVHAAGGARVHRAGKHKQAAFLLPVFQRLKLFVLPVAAGIEQRHAVLGRIDKGEIVHEEHFIGRAHLAQHKGERIAQFAGITAIGCQFGKDVIINEYGDRRGVFRAALQAVLAVELLHLLVEGHERLLIVPAAPHIKPPDGGVVGEDTCKGLGHLGQRILDIVGAKPHRAVVGAADGRIGKGHALAQRFGIAGAHVGLHKPRFSVQHAGADAAGESPVDAQRTVVDIGEGAGEEIHRVAFQHDPRGVMADFRAGVGVAKECADDLIAAGHALGSLAQAHHGKRHGIIDEGVGVNGLLLVFGVAHIAVHGVRALRRRGLLHLIPAGVVGVPAGVQRFQREVALPEPQAEFGRGGGGIIGILHGVVAGAQELLGGAAGHMPSGDIFVPAALHQPVLEILKHHFAIGQPFLGGEGFMQRRALRIAADLVGIGFVPPGGRFDHQSGNEVHLARLAPAHHAAEVLVGIGEVILAVALPEAGTEGPRAGIGVDAAVARINGAEEQLHAGFLKVLIPRLFGLIGHIAVQRHLFAALDFQQIQFSVFHDPAFHGYDSFRMSAELLRRQAQAQFILVNRRNAHASAGAGPDRNGFGPGLGVLPLRPDLLWQPGALLLPDKGPELVQPVFDDPCIGAVGVVLAENGAVRRHGVERKGIDELPRAERTHHGADFGAKGAKPVGLHQRAGDGGIAVLQRIHDAPHPVHRPVARLGEHAVKHRQHPGAAHQLVEAFLALFLSQALQKGGDAQHGGGGIGHAFAERTQQAHGLAVAFVGNGIIHGLPHGFCGRIVQAQAQMQQRLLFIHFFRLRNVDQHQQRKKCTGEREQIRRNHSTKPQARQQRRRQHGRKQINH